MDLFSVIVIVTYPRAPVGQVTNPYIFHGHDCCYSVIGAESEVR